MTNYHAVREFDPGITRDELDEAVGRSRAAIEEMREEGFEIAYLGSEIFTDEKGEIAMTLCRYDADGVEAVTEQSERAQLPFSAVLRATDPVEGIAPKAGVVRETA